MAPEPAPAAWTRLDSRGQAGPFHARLVPEPALPAVWCHRVDRPTLVLGSGQPAALVDQARAAALGVEVTRRRSGGGLVLVHPEHARWLDVVVPAGHERWCEDVGAASHWLGRAWAEAVRSTLPPDAGQVRPHEGALVRTRWSGVLCFAGLGPGEVTVGAAKVVGTSQRRTRGWARFQCLVLAEPDLDLLIPLLRTETLPGPLDDLGGIAMGHPLDLDRVVARFVGGLGAGTAPSVGPVPAPQRSAASGDRK